MAEVALGAGIFLLGILIGASLVYTVVGDLSKEKPLKNNDDKD